MTEPSVGARARSVEPAVLRTDHDLERGHVQKLLAGDARVDERLTRNEEQVSSTLTVGSQITCHRHGVRSRCGDRATRSVGPGTLRRLRARRPRRVEMLLDASVVSSRAGVLHRLRNDHLADRHVRRPDHDRLARVAQSVEAQGREPCCCRFDSCRVHTNIPGCVAGIAARL